MMQQARIGARHLVITTALVALSFALCAGLDMLSGIWTPFRHHGPHAVFLPFGMMILLGWIYGWLVVPLTAPVTFAAAYLLRGEIVLEPVVLAVGLARIALIPFSFDLLRRFGLDARGLVGVADWRLLLVAGLVASVIGNLPRVVYGACCGGVDAGAREEVYVALVAGDMAGMLIVMLAAMFAFRLLRHA